MKRLKDFIWPAVALGAMGFSFWLLYNDKDLRGLSMGDVAASLAAITPLRLFFAVCASALAYAALAWYDRIALMHLDRQFSWLFITLVSFTTYAISHNIGASMFAGGVVRYRAYSTKGLDVAEVAFLVAFCSFTFALGTVLLGGIVLTLEPEIVARLFKVPHWIARLAGVGMLAFVGLYVAGSTFGLAPLKIGKYTLAYPKLEITLRQLTAAPIELLGAAGIIYFALPEAGNPGYFIVLGVFLASFSAALLSHAPGGLGVLELVFLTAMPDMPKASVAAALLVFRLLYLIVPLLFSLVVVFYFEQARLARKLGARTAESAGAAASNPDR